MFLFLSKEENVFTKNIKEKQNEKKRPNTVMFLSSLLSLCV